MTRPLTITALGNAQISTAQSKFGSSSVSLDGTGDYLNINSTTELAFGTGDFCIEAWVYKTGGTSYHTIFDMRTDGSDGSGIILGINNVNQIYFYYNFGYRITTAAIANNTWTHIALARVNGESRVFINGTQSGVTYTDSNNYPQRGLHIGGDPLGNYNFPGYIDDIRISKGAGRYSGTFTAPATAFINDEYTSLLIHCDDSNGSLFFIDDALTQTSLDELYIEDNYFANDGYFVYIAEAEASTSGQFTATCSANVFVLADASAVLSSQSSSSIQADRFAGCEAHFTSTFTQSTTLSNIYGADLFAFSDAQLAAQANVIREYNLATSGIFDIATDYVRYRASESAFSDEFTFAGSAERSRDASMSTAAAFSFNCLANQTKGAISNITGVFTPVVNLTLLTDYFFKFFNYPAIATIEGYSCQLWNVNLRNFDFDSNGNIIALFQIIYSKRFVSPTEYISWGEFVKLDRYGSIIWRKKHKIGAGGFAEFFQDFCVGPDDSIYTGTDSDNNLTKLDSNGDVVWQKNYVQQIVSQSGSPPVFDRNGYLYTFADGTAGTRIMKWDPSNGTLLDQKFLNQAWQIRVKPIFDFDNNLILAYIKYPSPNSSILTKINTTNWTVSWAKAVDPGSGYTNVPNGLAIDNQNNIYVQTDQYLSSNGRLILSKFNSSGTVQWSIVDDAGSNLGPRGLTYDNIANRLYVYNNATSAPPYKKIGIASINPSNGQILWQKRAGYEPASPSNGHYYDIVHNFNNNAIYLSGYRDEGGVTGGTDQHSAIVKVPLNGSGVASSGLFSYATASAPTYTNASPWGNSTQTLGTVPTLTAASAISISTYTQGPVANEYELIPVTGASLLLVASASLTISSSVSAQVQSILGTASNQTSNFILNAVAGKQVDTTGLLDSQSNFIADVYRIQSADSQLSSNFTTTNQINFISSNQSNLETTFNININSTKIHPGVANFDSIFSELVAAAKTGNVVVACDVISSSVINPNSTVDSTQFLNVILTVVADIGKIVSVDVPLTNAVNLQSSVNYIPNFSLSDLISQTTLTVSGDVRVTAELDANIETSLSIIGDKFAGTDANLSSNISVYVFATTSGAITLDAFTNASVVCEAVKSVDINSTPSSQTNLNANTAISVTRQFASSLNSQTTLTSSPVKSVTALITTQAIATNLTVAAKDVVAWALCEFYITCSVTAVKTARTGSILNANTETNVIAVKTVNSNATLQTIVSVYAAGFTASDATAFLVANGGILTAAVKQASSIVTENIVSTLAATASVTKDFASQQTAISLVPPFSVERIAGTSSTITSTFAQSTLAGVQLSGVAYINSAMTFAVVIRELRLDEIVYVIPAEIWRYEIVAETRNHKIKGESRIHVITK